MRHALRPAALVREARRFVPELRRADFDAGPAGIRAQALARDGSLVDDFVMSGPSALRPRPQRALAGGDLVARARPR